MKKNELIPLKLEAFKTLNRTYGHYEHIPIYVKGGMPGQTVSAQIKRVRGNACEAIIKETICPADYETAPPCPQFGHCGGCAFLTMPYEMQLKHKENYILSLFESLNTSSAQYDGIFASPDITAYRNKMEFAFGSTTKGGPLCLGLHRKGSFYDILSAEDCVLVDADFRTLVKSVQKHCTEMGYSYYHRKAHTGLLRHLVLRRGVFTNQLLVNIVTSSQVPFDVDAFLNTVRTLDLKAEIKGVLHTVNDTVSDAIIPENVQLLDGDDFLTEKCLDKTFDISAFSFYQTNSAACEILYSVVMRMLEGVQARLLLDLYCGTGTIAQMLAEQAEEVIGVEIVPEAVEAAKQNALRNGIFNCTFVADDVLAYLRTCEVSPDVVVLDPPRAGLNPKALKHIIAFEAPNVLYVSCNPNALASDLTAFLEAGYTVQRLAIADMFPHTPHVETVVLLSHTN